MAEEIDDKQTKQSHLEEGNQDRQTMYLSAKMSQTYRGPLPAPEDFAAYKTTLASAPERILVMAEKEQEHRHIVEKDILQKKGRENLLGQILGFILVLTCLGIATFLGVEGHDVLAGTIITITAVLASIFVLKAYPQQNKKK